MNIRKIIREEVSKVLSELEIFDFKRTRQEDDFFEYTFHVDDIVYKVQVAHYPERHKHGTYEVGFGVEGESEEGYRTGIDWDHLNSVIHTVDKIVEEVVKEKLIRKIEFSGEKDAVDSNIPFIDNIRLKAYLRFVNREYPNAKISKNNFGNISIDMRTIYPEIFEGKETKPELIVKELNRINDDGNPKNEWRLEKNVEYDAKHDRVLAGVEVDNSKYGSMEIRIDSSDAFNLHVIGWTIYDSGEEDEKEFKNFEQLLRFLKSLFINSEPEQTIDYTQLASKLITDVMAKNDIYVIDVDVEDGVLEVDITLPNEEFASIYFQDYPNNPGAVVGFTIDNTHKQAFDSPEQAIEYIKTKLASDIKMLYKSSLDVRTIK